LFLICAYVDAASINNADSKNIASDGKIGAQNPPLIRGMHILWQKYVIYTILKYQVTDRKKGKQKACNPFYIVYIILLNPNPKKSSRVVKITPIIDLLPSFQFFMDGISSRRDY
jgi:hypothetical protein